MELTYHPKYYFYGLDDYLLEDNFQVGMSEPTNPRRILRQQRRFEDKLVIPNDEKFRLPLVFYEFGFGGNFMTYTGGALSPYQVADIEPNGSKVDMLFSIPTSAVFDSPRWDLTVVPQHFIGDNPDTPNPFQLNFNFRGMPVQITSQQTRVTLDGTDFENLADYVESRITDAGDTPSFDPYDPQSWDNAFAWAMQTYETPWDLYQALDKLFSDANIENYTTTYDGSVTSRAYMLEATVGIRRGIDRRVISSKRPGSLQFFPLVTQGSEVGATKMFDVDGGIDYPPLYITLRSFVDVYPVGLYLHEPFVFMAGGGCAAQAYGSPFEDHLALWGGINCYARGVITFGAPNTN